jgi:hypothetical protein
MKLWNVLHSGRGQNSEKRRAATPRNRENPNSDLTWLLPRMFVHIDKTYPSYVLIKSSWTTCLTSRQGLADVAFFFFSPLVCTTPRDRGSHNTVGFCTPMKTTSSLVSERPFRGEKRNKAGGGRDRKNCVEKLHTYHKPSSATTKTKTGRGHNTTYF